MTIPQPPRQPITRVTYPTQMPTGGTANAMPDDTTRLRAELERVTAERDRFVNAGRALVREHDWLKAKRDDLQARIDKARAVAMEMDSLYGIGATPNREDVEHLLAALSAPAPSHPTPEES